MLGLVGTAAAEQGIGLQADMLCQGLSYRAALKNGLAFEVVAHGRAFPVSDDYEYALKGELRIYKIFNPGRRIRFYVGGAAAPWMARDYGWDVESDWRTRWGISAGAILGLDIMVIEMDDGSGITLMPEVQLGYYTWQYIEDIWIGPGTGIGIRYVW